MVVGTLAVGVGLPLRSLSVFEFGEAFNELYEPYRLRSPRLFDEFKLVSIGLFFSPANLGLPLPKNALFELCNAGVVEADVVPADFRGRWYVN